MKVAENLAQIFALILSKRNFRGNQVTAVTTIEAIPLARPVEVIRIPTPVYIPQRTPLWEYLHTGRQMHERSPKKYFVWQRELDRRPGGPDYYSHQSPHRPLHTCALAAILAGIDGREAISTSLDITATVFRLSDFYNIDFNQFFVIGIGGIKRTLPEEIVHLFDACGWSRFHIQKWLQREVVI